MQTDCQWTGMERELRREQAITTSRPVFIQPPTTRWSQGSSYLFLHVYREVGEASLSILWASCELEKEVRSNILTHLGQLRDIWSLMRASVLVFKWRIAPVQSDCPHLGIPSLAFLQTSRIEKNVGRTGNICGIPSRNHSPSPDPEVWENSIYGLVWEVQVFDLE